MTRKEQSALIPSDAVQCDATADKKAQKALDNAKAKYPHALTEAIWRHGKKLSLLIACTVPGCDGRRFVHTSDLFQVKDCGEHEEPKAARKPEETKKARVRSKDGRKGSRKAPRARKASGKSRKPRSASTAEGR